MAAAFLLFVVVGPLIEIVAAVAVASLIGGFNTFMLIIALSIVGLMLLKVQGVAALGEIQRDLENGRPPARGMIDGFLRMAGAILLAIPGLVTATVGLLLLVPPVRIILTPLIATRLAKRAAVAVSNMRINTVLIDSSGVGFTGGFPGHMGGGSGRQSAGEFIDVEGWDVVDGAGSGDHLELPRGDDSATNA